MGKFLIFKTLGFDVTLDLDVALRFNHENQALIGSKVQIITYATALSDDNVYRSDSNVDSKENSHF